jgi:hypothetical protein
MSKVVCVLYPDPVDGYPTMCARDELPKLDRYPDGQRLPSPRGIDVTPGALLGSVSSKDGNWLAPAPARTRLARQGRAWQERKCPERGRRDLRRSCRRHSVRADG